MTSRHHVLHALALCVAAAPASAACTFPTALGANASIESRVIALSPEKTTRLPYAKDWRLQVRPTAKLSALTVVYSLDNSTAGPRSGRVVAVSNDGGCVWLAPMPRLHVNETGVFRLDQFSPAAAKPGGRGDLAAALLEELATIPSGLDPAAFRDAVESRAQAAIAATYAATDRLVARAEDGSFRPLDELLTETVVQDLDIQNAVNDILRRFLVVAQHGKAVIDAGGQTPSLSSCRSGATVAATVQLANDVVNGGAPRGIADIVARRLPLPDCAVTLFQNLVSANSGAVATNASLALQAVMALNRAPALAGLLAIAERAEALQQTSLSLATLDVPVGGDILERYTQADVMTVTLPGRSRLVQPFATATLYVFQDWRTNPQLTALVEPRNWGSDRFALQFGYPVGHALHAPDVPIEPQYLLGVQYRLNGLISVSSGAVVGKESGVQRGSWYLGTNLDISNVGPFQQLFARRDTP